MSSYINPGNKTSSPQQREAGMATRRQPPAVCGAGSPPYSNTGGKFLETQYYREESHPFAAHTDWLDCTFPLPDKRPIIREFIDKLGDVLGYSFGSMNSTNKGIHGWERSYTIRDTTAIFAIGGQRGRAFLRLPGSAIKLIDNDSWLYFIRLMTETYDGRITRWDGATDDFEGEHNLAWALSQYKDGGFSTGGNKPKISTVGDWISDNDTDGRTLNIGKRKNGKYLRIYEKGKQLGNPTSSWVRWEVEFKRKDREIPWEVLVLPGQYVAGAHKCMSWIDSKTSRIATYIKSREITEEFAILCCKNSWGKFINHLMEEHGDAEKVIELIRRDGIPDRLAQPVPPN